MKPDVLGFCSRWLAGLVLALMGLVAGAADLVDQTAAPMRLDQAWFFKSQAEQLPSTSEAWKKVHLPAGWRVQEGLMAGFAWFRFDIDLDREPTAPYAVYVPRLDLNGECQVNGAVIGRTGEFSDPMPLNWNRAHLFVVPSNLLHAGNNQIAFRMRTYHHYTGALWPVSFGPLSVLEPIFQQRQFWQTEVVQVLTWTMAALGLSVLMLWAMRRDQTVYLWFGLAVLVWAIHSLDYSIRAVPFPHKVWESFVHSSEVLFTTLLMIFIMRFIKMRRPWLEIGIWLYWLLGSAWSFVYSSDIYQFADDWFLGTLVAASGFWIMLVRATWREARIESILLVVAGAVTLALSAHDLHVFRNFGEDDLFLAHYGAPLFFLVVAWMLARRFAETLNAYEQLTRELEQRVSAKTQELRASFDRIKDTERLQTLVLERQRIMSEMHDGVGSQLTTALSMLEHEHADTALAARVLRECIDDLQLVIDSLEPTENDLLTVLGNLRYRLQQRLSSAGIEVDWRVRELPPLPWLTPVNVLHILRVMQEIFANVIKHARATRITVETGVCDEGAAGTAGVYIRVSDNGCGFGAVTPGRGLASMRRRAEKFGGRIELASGASGTVATIIVAAS